MAARIQHLDASSELLRSWCTGRDIAGAMLSRAPHGPASWRWRLRFRIFDFLVRRYGDDERRDPGAVESGTVAAPPAAPEACLGSDAHSPYTYSVPLPELRHRAALRAHQHAALEHFVEVGKHVRATAGKSEAAEAAVTCAEQHAVRMSSAAAVRAQQCPSSCDWHPCCSIMFN